MKKRNSNTCDGFIFLNNSNHSLLKRNVLKTTIVTFFGKKKTIPENFAFLILKILELLPVKFKFF